MKTLVSRSGRVIATAPHCRYDHSSCNRADLIGAGVDDKAELERRMNAGETLSTGEVAVLLDTSRWTVDRIVRDGTVINGVKYELGWTTLGRNREIDPTDVKKILEARRQRRATSSEPLGPDTPAVQHHDSPASE